jgi:hypothetical protein
VSSLCIGFSRFYWLFCFDVWQLPCRLVSAILWRFDASLFGVYRTLINRHHTYSDAEFDVLSTGFCGWCLEDCGQDAHQHVRWCKQNPRQGELFNTADEFSAVQNRRRRERVLQYLQTQVAQAAEQAAVRKMIILDLADLGIAL